MSGRVRSQELFARAQKRIPGGVNSPVRAFRGVDGEPLFIERGEGAYIFDADGNRFVDYVLSWGPLILGHCAPVVTEALEQAVRKGTSFGAPTEREVELAELLQQIVPSLEMVRLVNSGTEATMSAVRLARGFTGREHILKFNGCYHGHADALLVKAGSGVATLGIAGSQGVPQAAAAATLSIEFNDLELLSSTIKSVGPEKVAAVIIEPVPGNMGLVLPDDGFLHGVRDICSAHGIVLIFDEVMTGFRVALGGAQDRFNITPDLSTFGKVIGGGLPVGAFGGRADIMKLLAPSGPVYQAGTLSGNPLATAAGLAVLKELRAKRPHAALEKLAQRWADGMTALGKKLGVGIQASACGSMIGFFFSDSPVGSYADALRSDVARFKRFFHGMLDEGIYLAPSAFEAGFLSTAHNEQIIDETILAANRVLSSLSRP